MESEVEFRKQVKDALEHLYDTVHLETHPLLTLFAGSATDSRLTRAQKLRGLLKETIEALRPPEGSPSSSPEWRSYLALRYRYVQGTTSGETELELGISLRQLQRELHKGLDAVSALLWDKRITLPAELPETQELENELNQWEIARTACQMQTLTDDALWMLRPLLAERGVTLQVNLPADLTPVFVDATLTRQALFLVLRLLVKNMPPGVLAIAGRDTDHLTELSLTSPARVAYETEPDWQAAQLSCRQQGIALAARPRPDTGTEIVFPLPRATQAHVLVVDDNAALHQLFERYLAPHHYRVLHALNGPDAVRLAVEQRPDAITLDVMMPHVDGWQVLRTLTSNPLTAGIPVIVCSVLREPELAFSLGARAYLKKPVERTQLVATLARLLSSAAPAAEGPQSRPADK